MSDNTFLGRGWSFPPHFTSQGLVIVAAEEDIRESLLILLSTRPGERVMQPTYGCDLHGQVFATLDEGSFAAMRDRVEKAILLFEPRVIVDQVEVRPEDEYEGHLQIHVYYRVRATNNRYNLVYPFYFNEASNITS